MGGKVSQRPDRTRRFTPGKEERKRNRKTKPSRKNMMFKRKETLKSKGRCSDRRAQQLLRISPHQTLGVPREKVGLSVHTHTHTARQHKREKQTRDRILKLQVSIRVEAGTGKRTKNGYRTKRRKTRTWVGSEHKHALLISSFPLAEGTRKQGGR